MTKDRPYRPAAGIMLLNSAGKVFVGQRIDTTLEAWQMPQGGLDPGEAPRAAALRELAEETGIAPALVEIVAEAPEPLDYDLPPELADKVWGGRYRGQRQYWFLCRFLGADEDVDLGSSHAEFRAWKWADPAELPAMIVPFKRALYARLIEVFGEYLSSERAKAKM